MKTQQFHRQRRVSAPVANGWRLPRTSPQVLRCLVGECRSGAGPERCFGLETMSVDGQGWVMDELGQKLVGLAHRTPRAVCRTTELLSYRGDLSEGDKSMRCDRLDLDLGWEAKTSEGKTLTGQAKVTLCNKDSHDVVDLAVSVDPACVDALTGERGKDNDKDKDRVVADVIYAVESLDTAIMEKLNDFLWSMEQHNARPERS